MAFLFHQWSTPATIRFFQILAVIVVIINDVTEATSNLNVVYAVNAGGERFRDSHGINYQRDPSTEGIPSDFGLRLDIDRVDPRDQLLYQTERFSKSSFGYDIPIMEDGSYVLVLKFSEVYFREPGRKVFDVLLNSAHIIVQELDIFGYVGHAAAHDEIVPFRVTSNGKKLIVGSSTSGIVKNKIKVEFMKGLADNPKVNAFYVIKGTVEDIPRLPSPRTMDYGEVEDEESYLYSEDDEDIHFSRSDLGHEDANQLFHVGSAGGAIDVRSGPPAEDPWDKEPAHIVYMPLLGSVAASVAAFYFVRFFSEKL